MESRTSVKQVISPSVSIAIPVYNEAHYIEKLVYSFLATLYPNLVEVMIADGGSTDGTQDIIQHLSTEDSRVRLLHNPQKVQSAGLNLILLHCTGDIFLRADAHSDYASDYIERCVELLLESQALNIGGATRFAAKTPFQAGVALASKSFLGGGSAKHRNPDYDGYADTLFLGCFWRKTLQTVSGYSTDATTNEDAELNLRLQKLFVDMNQIPSQDTGVQQNLMGKTYGAVYVSSKIKVWYYPRNTWKSLLIQYFKYGRGRYLTDVKHPKYSPIRGKLPFVVISGTIIMGIISFFVQFLQPFFKALILVGLLSIILEGLRVTSKFSKNFSKEIWRGVEHQLPSTLSCWFFCVVSLTTMLIAHFAGYAYQNFRHNILKISGW
ncbi:glycosyltransferase family 2 protein [Anabaena lutea]|uniref:Glycosyltransferase family 2 protein n=1 Tax=Anabaena lutea FACHB-196 TaxID=2692881 RepID=A0ABR8FHN6_9NOST|nr:glycosyltransferase family 2 protein [Anabaena lutea]MBD2569385.1 glycosyltransferase family 2 protein [Anabaena lutea FACHB-196]